FFEKSADEQRPNSLWICCSDSRVSPELITHSDGEIFVLRNVANQFKLKDLGSLSALEYAVNKLNVRHIFVCGHYGCGGVNHIIDSVCKYLKYIIVV
ncbi:carbonic anhydrase, partial [Gigaspora rosea]